VFHFSRAHGIFNPPPLDLSPLGSPILSPKSSWCYLSFIFDRKLSSHSHIDFYMNKAISTIKYMKILSNSTRDLNSYQKCLLYRCCTILITLYDFQLWHYNKAPLSYLVTNFIQLVSPQPVDRFSQTKLCWKTPNEGYPHICGMYKSNNKQLRYQAISSCKSFIC